jgi:hypothetical protein
MINLIILVVVLSLVLFLTRNAPGLGGIVKMKADLNAFTKYARFRLGKGKAVTAEDVENVESFALAMGVEFTARDEANALKNQLPKTVKYLNKKAEKALVFWNKMNSYAKTLSVVAGIVVFGLLYKTWAGPLWEMLKTSGQFLYSLLLSAPYTVAGVAIFLVAAYAFKKTAPARKAKYQAAAKAIEKRIPEVNKMADILNQ